MASKFGGIAVDDSGRELSVSKFGGIPVYDEAVPIPEPAPQLAPPAPVDPNEPIYSDLPVGEPRHMAAAINTPLVPLQTALNTGLTSPEDPLSLSKEFEEKGGSILDFADMAGRKAAKELGGFDVESGGEEVSMTPEFGGQVAQIAVELAALEPYTKAMRVLGGAAVKGLEVLGQRYGSRVSQIDKRVADSVKKGMTKGVKYSVGGKSDAGKVKKFLKGSEKAVVSIIDNSAGKLPKTLEEFSEAIHTTKKSIYEKYSTLALEAGEEGAMVSIKPIRDDLMAILEQPNTRKSTQDLARRMIDEISAYDELISPAIAEDLITSFNSETKAFWRNPTASDASNAAMTERTARQLRKATDKTISEYTGPGYQELKNEYGALSSIEKEVTHRATVDIRKNVKGFYDLADIASAGEFTLGIARMDPTLMISAAAVKGTKKYIKHLVNPNRYIKNMFSDVDKLVKSRNQQLMSAAIRAGDKSPEVQAAKLVVEDGLYYKSDLPKGVPGASAEPTISQAVRDAMLKKSVEDINKYRKSKGLKPLSEKDGIKIIEATGGLK